MEGFTFKSELNRCDRIFRRKRRVTHYRSNTALFREQTPDLAINYTNTSRSLFWRNYKIFIVPAINYTIVCTRFCFFYTETVASNAENFEAFIG